MTFLSLFFLVACPSGPDESPSAPTVAPTSAPPRHVVTFRNRCTEAVWVGSVGNAGMAPLGGGGWLMPPGSPDVPLEVPVGWSGRFWPRTGCRFDADGHCDPKTQPCCASGSCLESDDRTFGMYCATPGMPPVSLVELTLDAPSGNGPIDTFDVSFVDGWSVPVAMAPVPGTFNPAPDPGLPGPWCVAAGCTTAPTCPEPYRVPGSSACQSPCRAASAADATRYCCVCTTADPACDCTSSTTPGNPQFGCCTGGYGCTPYHQPPYPEDQVCDPWSPDPGRAWDATAQSYVAAVRGACPLVYAWQFDDQAATVHCRKTDGRVNYTVTFCP